MLVGYARVSTGEQNLNLQLDALKQMGCEQIFDDEMSGAKAERPGLRAALKFIRSGDTLVVWRLDQLGRSLRHLTPRMPDPHPFPDGCCDLSPDRQGVLAAERLHRRAHLTPGHPHPPGCARAARGGADPLAWPRGGTWRWVRQPQRQR